MSNNLPTGTVTFLFTDIEGSTKLAQQYPEAMPALLARHNEILNQAAESHNGFVFQVVGDSYAVSFHNASDALNAVLQAQRNLHNENWHPAPIKVRMGIHTGAAQLHIDSKENKYSGYATIALTQRIMSAGHGGQTLVSNTTENLLRGQLPKDICLRDMGEHKFKDVLHPMRVFQVIAPDLQCEFPALHALDIFPNNLPAQLTSFIGREKEIVEIDKALADHRLITVTGSGGTGKTRLAIEVGAAQVANAQTNQRFVNGVYFVALAPLETTESIVPTIASALGFSFYEGGEPHQQLLDYLREKSILLIMDNFEHLLSGVDLVSEVLNAAPNVKVIATSRARLNIQGEQLFHLSGMDFPVWETPADALDYGAVKLFLQSANRIHLDFALTSDNLKFITRICRLVEGMPLGILLASSWLGMLTPQEIAAEIEKSLDFLETNQRDVPERQHSIRAVFDYSWKLLTPGEQNVFMKASVFRGGFTREAAQQVTGASLRDLMGLVDKSLLQRNPSGRYNIHELLRQYAHEKLIGTGEEQSLRNRHLEWHVELSERAAPEFHKHRQLEWLNCIEDEYENLHTAFEWALVSKNAESALRIPGALDHFWSIRGRVIEARSWSERALELADNFEHLRESKWRAGALSCLGGILVDMGDFSGETAQKLLTEGLAIYRKWDDKAGIATCLAELAIEQSLIGEQNKACELIDEALSMARETGDAHRIGTILDVKAVMLPNEAYSVSLSLMKESMNYLKETGDRWQLAFTMQDMATYLLFAGGIIEAKNLYSEAMTLFSDVKVPYGVADCVSSLGFLERERGQYATAVQYYQQALQNYRDAGYKNGVGVSLYRLGNIEFIQLHLDQASEYFEYCKDVLTLLEDKQMLAILDACIGKLFLFQNKESEAEQILKQSLSSLKAPNSNAYHALSGLGELARRQGRFEVALQYFRKGINVLGKFDRTFHIAYVLDGVAKTFSDLNESESAARLFGAIDSMRRQWGSVVHPVYQTEYDRYIALLRKKLGDANFESIWAEGESLSIEQAIELALEEKP